MIQTPKEKEKIKLVQEEKYKKMYDATVLDFNTVAATPEGINVFKYIMERCSYQKPIITYSKNGDVDKDTTVFLEARRGLYLELRKYIDPKFLKKIEFK